MIEQVGARPGAREISGTGIGLTTTLNQPLATKGTFLAKFDIKGLGQVTHPVIVLEQLVWPLLLGYGNMAIYGAKVDAGRSVVSWDWKLPGGEPKWFSPSRNIFRDIA